MTNYARGKRAEDKTKRWLEAAGYTVISSRGSHGAVDLVAVNETCVRFIQVKSGRKLSTEEYAKMLGKLQTVPEGASRVRREIVTWKKFGREPSVESI